MDRFSMTRCEIDLDRFEENIETVKALAGDAVPMAVIKANAYGHGAAVLMRKLFTKGIRYFGVANIGEAMELRRTFHRGGILVLGYTPPHLMHYAADYDVALTVFTIEQARTLESQGAPVKVHIALNTGLNRLGFQPCEQTVEEVVEISKMENVRIEGIFTHFAKGSHGSDERQAALFRKMTDEMEARGVELGFKHASDGIALTKYGSFGLNMVRPGALFYGYGPGVKPIMSIRSQIIHVHSVPAGQGVSYGLTDAVGYDRVVATLPYGYSDGVPMGLSHGQGYVTIRGKKAPYVGVVCMDMCLVDVTDIPEAAVGDPVTVIGDGDSEMTFDEAADKCGVNVNSLVSGIARRVPRVYLEHGEEVMFTDYLF